MAQCRIKKLEKMERIEEVVVDRTIEFNFPVPDILPPPLIKIEDGEFGYSPDKILYRDM